MRRISATLLAAGLSAALLAPAAHAQVAANVSLRTGTQVYAGPGYDYPRVDYLAGGQRVTLFGCLSDNRWCDISAGYDRGWVPATNLVVWRGGSSYGLYQSRSWYPYPIISFLFGSYWNDHYRNRSWYHDRNHWNRWDHGRWDRDRNNDGRIDRRYRDRDRDGIPNQWDRDRNNDGRLDPRFRDRDRDGIPIVGIGIGTTTVERIAAAPAGIVMGMV